MNFREHDEPRPAIHVLVFLLTVTGMMSTTMIAPVVPALLADLNQPTSMAGLVLGAGTLPGIILAPVTGLLADKYGRRRVLVPSLFGFAVTGVLTAFAPDIAYVIALRLMQGFFSASLINLAIVLVGDYWHGPRRYVMLGRNSAVLTSCVMFLAPLGGVLTDIGGWRLAFTPYAIGIPMAWMAHRLLTDPIEVDVQRRLGADMFAAFRELRRKDIAAPLLVGLGLFMLMFGLIFTALPLHLEQQFAATSTTIGVVIGVSGLSATLIALNIGRIGRHWQIDRVLIVASVCFACGFVILGASPWFLLLPVGVLLTGSGDGLMVPTLQAALSSAARPEQRGAIMSLWGSVARASQTFGPVVAGFAVGLAGTTRVLAIGGAGIAAVMILGIMLLYAPGPMRSTNQR